MPKSSKLILVILNFFILIIVFYSIIKVFEDKLFKNQTVIPSTEIKRANEKSKINVTPIEKPQEESKYEKHSPRQNFITIEEEMFAKESAKPSEGKSVYLLSLECPPNYGLHKIKCESLNKTRTDIKLLGFSKNVPDVDQEGAFCSYEAFEPFKGKISAECVQDLYNVRAYNLNDFLPGKNSIIPESFELWGTRTVSPSEVGTTSITIKCPEDYTASYGGCYLRDSIHEPGVNLIGSSSRNNVTTYTYNTNREFEVSLRTYCLKN